MREDIPATLQAHLDTRETTLAWCWSIRRTDNVVLGFTNHDRDLTFDNVTYKASTGFLGTEVEARLGMSVDNMDVFGAMDSENILESDIAAGRYDNALVILYLVNWQDVSERVVMKQGNVGNIKRGKTAFEGELRGLSHETQQPQGRLYNYKCDALLGDSRCKRVLTSSTFTGTGTITSTTENARMIVSGINSYASRWFEHGKITMTSGTNNGLTREVKGHLIEQGTVLLSVWEPFPFLIAANDTFTIVAGCDKLFKTCKAKFQNEVNFRGFPHVPGNKIIQQYVNQGDGNLDGGGNFFGKD